jgi:hypothetical protein
LETAGEMNKKFTMFFSVLIILAFIGYIIFDTARPEGFTNNSTPAKESNSIPDAWKVSGEIKVKEGPLTSVTVAPAGSYTLEEILTFPVIIRIANRSGVSKLLIRLPHFQIMATLSLLQLCK